jgi:hypothetical protein
VWSRARQVCSAWTDTAVLQFGICARRVRTPSPAPPSDRHPPVKDIAELVELYRTHKDSLSSAARYQTRSNYDYLLRRITQDRGNSVLAQMGSQHIIDLHERWKSGGKGGDNTYFAHSLVTMHHEPKSRAKPAQRAKIRASVHRYSTDRIAHGAPRVPDNPPLSA